MILPIDAQLVAYRSASILVSAIVLQAEITDG